MFELKIKTSNAAYRDDDYNLDSSNYELIRNLKSVIHKLESGYDEGIIMDINGNRVGEWKLED